MFRLLAAFILWVSGFSFEVALESFLRYPHYTLATFCVLLSLSCSIVGVFLLRARRR